MANEISARAYLTCTKDGSTVTGDTTYSYTLTGSQKWTNTQTIGTTTEQLAFPSDLTTEGISFFWVKNLDTTNYVDVATATPATTHIFTKLKAGQVAVFPSPTANPTFYAIANTAAVNLQIVAVGT